MIKNGQIVIFTEYQKSLIICIKKLRVTPCVQKQFEDTEN